MDAGLAGANTFGFNMSSMTTGLPSSLISMSGVSLTFNPYALVFNTTQTLLDSVKLNLQIDASQLLPTGSGAANSNALFGMLGINLNDFMGMLAKPIAYL